MRFVIGGRQAGKTIALLDWVRAGRRRATYPFWSRVIVTATEREASRLRKEGGLEFRQVFSFADWRLAHRTQADVEIAVDDIDLLLRHLIGDVQVASATGQIGLPMWEPRGDAASF